MARPKKKTNKKTKNEDLELDDDLELDEDLELEDEETEDEELDDEELDDEELDDEEDDEETEDSDDEELDEEDSDDEIEEDSDDEELDDDEPKKKSSKKKDEELDDEIEEDSDDEIEEDSDDEIEEDSDDEIEKSSESIKIKDVVISEDICRTEKNLDKSQIKELADSIKSVGLLNPIIVNESSELVAGLRRLLAYKLLKKKEIPCITYDIKKNEKHGISIIENLQRSDLSLEDKGKGFKALLDNYPKKYPNQRSLAKFLGIPESRVSEALKEIGEGKVTKNKEKSKTKSDKRKRPKSKRISIKKDSLPPNIEVIVYKDKVYFGVDIPMPKKVERLDYINSISKSLKEIDKAEFIKEVKIANQLI